MSVARQVSQAEMGHALLKALMTGPVRALDLIKRVPEEFARRHWPRDEDSYAVVACAIGAAKLNIGAQRFTLPPALMSHLMWRRLVEKADAGGKVTALEIVEGMGLERLLEPG